MSVVRLVKARKNHICKYCDLKITKGEFYYSVNITPWCHPDNESFDVWKIHKDCKKDGDKFFYIEGEGIFPDEPEDFRRWQNGEL